MDIVIYINNEELKQRILDFFNGKMRKFYYNRIAGAINFDDDSHPSYVKEVLDQLRNADNKDYDMYNLDEITLNDFEEFYGTL